MKQTTLDLNGPILGFSTHPQNVTVNNAGIATFIGIATAYFTSQNPTNIFSSNTGVVTHRWYAAGIGALSDGTNTTLGATLSGTATTTLTLSNVTSPTTNGIQLFVSADYVPSAYQSSSPITAGTGRSTGNAINEILFSNTATLTVRPNIIIRTEPIDITVEVETRVTFSVSASLTDGTTSNLSYRWQLNEVDLTDSTSVSGSSTPTLSISQSVVGDNTVRVRISHPTASNSPVFSRFANFIVNQKVVVKNILNFEYITSNSSSALLDTVDLTNNSYTYNVPITISQTSSTTSTKVIRWQDAFDLFGIWAISNPSAFGSSISIETIINKIVFYNGTFFALGSRTLPGTLPGIQVSLVLISQDAINWTLYFEETSSNTVIDMSIGIRYNNKLLVFCPGAIYIEFYNSSDVRSFKKYERSFVTSSSRVYFASGIFTLINSNTNDMYKSVDGINWQKLIFTNIGSNITFNSIAHNGSWWCLSFNNGGKTFTANSFDNLQTVTNTDSLGNLPIKWEAPSGLGSSSNLLIQSNGSGLFIAATSSGIYWSSDGLNWNLVQSSSGAVLNYGYQGNQLIAVYSNKSTIYWNRFTSSDLPFVDANSSNSFADVALNITNIVQGRDNWITSQNLNGRTRILRTSGPIIETITTPESPGIKSLLSFYAPENDVNVALELYAEKGLDNGSFKGGEGGTSTIRFTAKKNEEYIISINGKGSTITYGGGIFVYRKGTLIASCGSGGNAGTSGNGGSGGGVNVVGGNGFGSNSGIGGALIQRGTLSPTGGIVGSVSAITPLSGDTKALSPAGGRTISCPKGNYWISRGFSPCSDVGTTRFFLRNGTQLGNTALILRGYKEGYTLQETSGLQIGKNGGNGGEGATGGAGGQNISGGGGGSGYVDGSVTIVSTQQGGNSSSARVVFKL